jgi:hypothetical protein
MLPVDPEALVRCPHHPKEAAPLLRVTPDHDRVILPPRGGDSELGGDRKNR